jgi:MoxR-like ATPase
VKLAIALDMPLLLEGDPGCGKTCLAGAIAYEFTQKIREIRSKKEEDNFWYPFEVWNVTSSTRAVDGRYTYDALRRLRDAQLAGSNLEALAKNLGKDGKAEVTRIINDLKDRENYLTLGKLGRSFQREDYRPVLLIDEIDKADNDFPNDLLREIEEFSFEIPETGKTIPDPERKAYIKKPIIIITSNREKPLPDPFLRRCIYFYVNFPDDKRLRDIIHNRFDKGTKAQQGVDDQAIAKFTVIRNLLEDRPGSRPPGTSEFLKFLDALRRESTQAAKQKLKTLHQQRSLLGILIKSKDDLDLVTAKLASS